MTLGMKYNDLWKSHKDLLKYKFIKPVAVNVKAKDNHQVFKFNDKPTLNDLTNGYFVMGMTINYEPEIWSPAPGSHRPNQHDIDYIEYWLDRNCRNINESNFISSYVNDHCIIVHLKSMKDRKVGIILES